MYSKSLLNLNYYIITIKNGHVEVASFLLKHGALFDEPDSSLNSPMHYAAAYGFAECIDELKRAGANVNTLNSWNLSPLSVALAKGHFGCVKKLLAYPEIDVNCKDSEGRTILSKSIDDLSPKTLEYIQFLL